MLVNRFNNTSVVAQTDRPKSFRNHCVIEVFVYVESCVDTLLFGFFYGCRCICHRTESDLFLFVLSK